MTTAQGRQRPPQMKASDADRDEVVAALSEHFQAGRLTTEELEDRTGRALSARTLGELDALTTDLPARRQAKSAPEASPQRRGHAELAVLAAVLAVLAVVALVVGVRTGHHGLDIWVVVPIALIVVRRLGRRQLTGRGGLLSGRHGMLTGSRRDWLPPSEDSRPD
jgi:Domain of unknown function (DUF1707)